ncbi:hypothetical protein J3R30DRAFT_2752760 [Lentinula aciculospora]|uniref:HMG box domain-containing protein n=1 Tax=Lentinula aciculospora TaxID=153920 RepID=A0A9W9ADC6_9AGAR|nr:hypothetical protein J3R30DRAFT_2752760 [Lentinula aciculospora]
MPPLRTYDAPSQALEVDIDSSSLPTLAIVAPTPRAFTFPDPHTLNVSPYSTPINSPFEPDLYPLTHTSPPSSCLPSHSQDAFLNSSASLSTSSITSFYSSYKQASLDERRPQKGDDDYIKRPENAFILFRRKCCEDHQQAEEEGTGRHGHPKKQRQADLSKSISRQWKALSAEDRRHWENQAKEKKLVHQQMYPDYVYLPKRVRDQDGKARNKKYTKRRTTKAGLKGDANVVTAYVVPPQQISRSTSAPTPPPSSYQTIHIPNVYPSSSSSFSLLPMISRRAGYTGNANDTMSNFDFPPSNLPAPLYTNPSYGMGLQVMC